MKHRYQSFTRIGRQFQSLKRQVYVGFSFPSVMTNTDVVIFLVESIIPDIRISSTLINNHTDTSTSFPVEDPIDSFTATFHFIRFS